MPLLLEPDELEIFETIIDKVSVHRNDKLEHQFKAIDGPWEKSTTVSIGSGSYGSVRLGRNKGTGDKVAVKRVNCDKDGVSFSIIREIACLRKCQHNNVIPLLGTLFTKAKTYLILELFDCSLAQFLKRLYTTALDLQTTERIYKNLFYQLLQGTLYIHSIGIIHGDLKPQNILLNREGRLVIADFGISQTLNGKTQLFRYTPMQTRWYRAPEVLLGAKSIGTAADMWSLGCILLEHASERHPFQGANDNDQLRVYSDLLGSITKKQYERFNTSKERTFSKKSRWLSEYVRTKCIFNSDLFYNFVSRCLVYLPEYRLTAQESIQHKWFDSEIKS